MVTGGKINVCRLGYDFGDAHSSRTQAWQQQQQQSPSVTTPLRSFAAYRGAANRNLSNF